MTIITDPREIYRGSTGIICRVLPNGDVDFKILKETLGYVDEGANGSVDPRNRLYVVTVCVPRSSTQR